MSRTHPRRTSTAESADPSADTLSFLRALEVLDHGVAFFDRQQELLHANRFLEELLDEERAGDRLRREIVNFASDLCSPGGAEKDRVAERAVVIDGDAFQLRGRPLDFDFLGGGPSVLVSVEPPIEARLGPRQLQERFGLSARECRVAQLLVRGLPNEEIAATLHVSPHTARHHTGSVLRKVGARSRTEAAAKLLGLAVR